ncbi:ferritin family protein [Mycobacterium tuberculosis T85]|nr:ferritin family protein [Mycobacterium tuberculosis T85]
MQEQIHNEFTAAQQYVAIAVYFDSEDLPQLAKHFYSQAVEERNHAMMLVQHLLDRDLRVEIPGVDPVRNQFDRPREALALALDQERTVTDQVGRLTAVAPATRAISSASSSCSGSCRNRSKRWP